MKLFVSVSAFGLIITILLSYLGMNQILHKYSMESAEHDSTNIGYTLYQMEHETLIDESKGKIHSIIPDEGFNAFDGRMRKLLAPMNIIKIKIFSPSGYIIYSTDHSLIGKPELRNEHLQKALKGEIVSILQKKESMADLVYEKRFNIDVVETYLPMVNEEGEILGAYEVYLDITRYIKHIESSIKVQLVMLFGILLVVFTLLTFIVWRAVRQK